MTDGARRRAGAGLIVAVCFLIAALEGYDIQAFGVAAPRFAPELGLDPSQMGWAGGVAMIGLIIGAFTGGWLADRIGRKPVLIISTAAFGVFSIVTALTRDFDSLLVARLATGLGFGGAMPNLIAIATEISSPSRRAATVTMMFCGMPVGGAAVSLLAKFGDGAIDWRTLFAIGGVLPLLIVPIVFFLLPETKPRHDPDADRGLLKALFGQGRAAPTLLLWLIFILTLIVLYLFLNLLPTLVVAKGMSPADGSTASLVFNLASVPGALLLGAIVDRVGFRWPLAAVFAGLAAALYGLSVTGGLNGVLVLSGAAGFLVIGANYALYALAPVFYAPQVRAAGAGTAVAVGRIGSVIGPLLAGQLRAADYSADQVIMALIPGVVLAAVLVVVLMSVGKPYAE